MANKNQITAAKSMDKSSNHIPYASIDGHGIGMDTTVEQLITMSAVIGAVATYFVPNKEPVIE